MEDNAASVGAWDSDTLRTKLSELLSEMYRKEVPLYGDLLRIVSEVDNEFIDAQASANGQRATTQLPQRHRLERHGAIRLGSPSELHTMRRLFAMFAMYPVGYYDLSVVGFPLHATAFRPLDGHALEKNPFRVFTTLLRRDLLSAASQDLVISVLSERKLFSARLLELIEKWEADGTITSLESDDVLHESLKIFKWHGVATVNLSDYERLKNEHPTVADIVSFPSAHINHLTPRTLDIDQVQCKMIAQGIPAKERIEGPPRRDCGILLRQTSFKALEEPVGFQSGSAQRVDGFHTARFGEIEQRGAAVTRKGRALYDKLLAMSNLEAEQTSATADRFNEILQEVFKQFPDTWSELHSQGLIFCRYLATPSGIASATKDESAIGPVAKLSELLEAGYIVYEPITYEDFLPVSAAGIFTSNLSISATTQLKDAKSDRTGFEQALGRLTVNEMDLYEELQAQSLEECRRTLRLARIIS